MKLKKLMLLGATTLLASTTILAGCSKKTETPTITPSESGSQSTSPVTPSSSVSSPVESSTAPVISIYTVSFNLNTGEELDPQKVKKGEAVAKPSNPSRSGYVFAGWYLDEECNTAYDFASPVNSDLILYAKWEEVKKDTYLLTIEYHIGESVKYDVISNPKLVSFITPSFNDYTYFYPRFGYGTKLQDYFNNVEVINLALSGRSSKSFYDNGRLDTILNSMKKNDYLLIQFGINDSASGNSERYAPVCGNIPGTNGSFESYMAKYIEGAKDKGATPILVTTVIGLKAYNSKTGQFENSYTNYCSAMKQLASYYNVPIIDLNTLMVNYYNSIGYDSAYKYHMCSTGSADMTHFTETGAKAIAGLVADELKRQGLC